MNSRFSDFVGVWFLAQILLVTAICAFGNGCTDAAWDRYRQYGSRAEVQCKSGGRLSFHGVSTGKVENETNSDGYFARWEIIYLDNKTSPWRHARVGDVVPATMNEDCTIIYFDAKAGESK